MPELMRKRRITLAVTLGFYAVTIYFRGLETTVQPWQLIWVLWFVSHDSMALMVGYHVGSIRSVRSFQREVKRFPPDETSKL